MNSLSDLIESFENCGDPTVRLDEKEELRSLSMAAMSNCRELRSLLHGRSEWTIDEWRTAMKDEEYEHSEFDRRDEASTAKVMVICTKRMKPGSNNRYSIKRQARLKNDDVTCYACGATGHYASSCTANGVKCYQCGRITASHIAATCPNRPHHEAKIELRRIPPSSGRGKLFAKVAKEKTRKMRRIS